MANRNNVNFSNRLNRANQLDAPSVSYISESRSSARQNNNNSNVDDVIVSLANAYENRRARQATEWELMGRQNLRQLL